MVSRVFLDLINRLTCQFGLTLTPSKNLLLVYQHDYGTGGFERYRALQILHNKRKIERVWADEETIAFLSSYLRSNVKEIKRGICHGTRRGYEQTEFGKQLGCPVLGTEISDTAKQFPNTVQWDFHERKPEWRGIFSFVYSNSLDQAFDPEKALAAWADQLTEDGLLLIEHTMLHSAASASDMDPFGAHPMVMPYLIFVWGKGKYRLVDILRPPHKKMGMFDIWIFVIRRGLVSAEDDSTRLKRARNGASA